MAEKWEQSRPGDDEGVDEVVQRYLDDADMQASDSGPGSQASPGQGAASEEDFDPAEQIVERVMEKLGSELDRKLSSIRQDLQEYAERTAQSFSDKTAHRLTRRQREQLEQVERILAPLKDHFGPEYDEVVTQAKLQALFAGSGEQDDGTETPEQSAQPPQGPAAGQSVDQFVEAYLAQKLGAPSQWEAEEYAAIQRDLSQARDWSEWIAVVERYAERGPSQTDKSQGPQGSGSGNVARAHMVGASTGKRPQPSLEALNRAYNRAAEEGDFDAQKRIGAQIDKILAQQR